tara:strand:+ start:7122 stop:7775 length:654 start_codon:yes stop_codon:yes gene_type:complete
MTPNGFKLTIMLEELGVPYTLKPVNIGEGENKKEDFTTLTPNQKIPVIVDHKPKRGKSLTLWESGAILIYLAEKEGAFLPKTGEQRAKVLQWLMLQMSGIGPYFGNAFHFKKATSEKLPYSLKRFMGETQRLCSLLDHHLSNSDYLAKNYSIADISTYPWIRSLEHLGVPLGKYLHLKRWYHMIDARPKVQEGMSVFKAMGLVKPKRKSNPTKKKNV